MEEGNEARGHAWDSNGGVECRRSPLLRPLMKPSVGTSYYGASLRLALA